MTSPAPVCVLIATLASSERAPSFCALLGAELPRVDGRPIAELAGAARRQQTA